MLRPTGRLGVAALAAAFLASGCEPGPAPATNGATVGEGVLLLDASGEEVALPRHPDRIVSLVPSVTRILVELGATERLVGRTDHDALEALAGLPSVGGGLEPTLEILASLEPEVVIRFAGESDPTTPARLEELGIAHLGVRPDGIEDVRRIVTQMGRLVGREARADSLVAALDRELEAVRSATAGRETVRAAFLLGGTPPWVAGPGTFIEELIELAGGENVFADLDRLYGPVSPEVIRERAPSVLLTGPGTTLEGEVVGDARRVELPAGVELPGLDLPVSAWAVARALHPGLRR